MVTGAQGFGPPGRLFRLAIQRIYQRWMAPPVPRIFSVYDQDTEVGVGCVIYGDAVEMVMPATSTDCLAPRAARVRSWLVDTLAPAELCTQETN